MTAPRPNLEDLPMDIAVAITRFGLAMNDCGGIAIGDERAFFTTGNVAADRRAELVAAIKRALAPAADKATVDAPIETPDTDRTFTELFGEPRPEIAAFFADHPEIVGGASC